MQRRFGYVIGVPFKIELLTMMSFIHLANSTLGWRPLEYSARTQSIWDVQISRGNIKYGKHFDKWIKFVVYHLYVIEYICSCISPIACFIKLYPILTWSRPKLLLPWLIMHALDIVIRKATSLIIIIILYTAEVLPSATFAEYLLVEFVNMFLAIYNWYTSIGLFWDLSRRETDRKLRALRIELKEKEALNRLDISRKASSTLHHNYVSVPNFKELEERAYAEENHLERSKSDSTLSLASNVESDKGNQNLLPTIQKSLILNMTSDDFKTNISKAVEDNEFLEPNESAEGILETVESEIKNDSLDKLKSSSFKSSKKVFTNESELNKEHCTTADNEMILARKFMTILNVAKSLSDDVSLEIAQKCRVDANEYSDETNESETTSYSLATDEDYSDNNVPLELRGLSECKKNSYNINSKRSKQHVDNLKPRYDTQVMIIENDKEISNHTNTTDHHEDYPSPHGNNEDNSVINNINAPTDRKSNDNLITTKKSSSLFDMFNETCSCNTDTESDYAIDENQISNTTLVDQHYLKTRNNTPKFDDNEIKLRFDIKSEKSKRKEIYVLDNSATCSAINDAEAYIRNTLEFVIENCITLGCESKVKSLPTSEKPNADNGLMKYMLNDGCPVIVPKLKASNEFPTTSDNFSRNWWDVTLKTEEVTQTIGLMDKNSVSKSCKSMDTSKPLPLNTEFVDILYEDMKQLHSSPFQQLSDNASSNTENNFHKYSPVLNFEQSNTAKESRKFSTLSGSADYCKHWIIFTSQLDSKKNTSEGNERFVENIDKISKEVQEVSSKHVQGTRFDDFKEKAGQSNDDNVSIISKTNDCPEPHTSNQLSNSNESSLQNAGNLESSNFTLDAPSTSSILKSPLRPKATLDQPRTDFSEQISNTKTHENLQNKDNYYSNLLTSTKSGTFSARSAISNKLLQSREMRGARNLEYLKMYNNLTLMKYKRKMHANENTTISNNSSMSSSMIPQILGQSNDGFNRVSQDKLRVCYKHPRSKPIANRLKIDVDEKSYGNESGIPKKHTRYRRQSNWQASQSPTTSCKRMEGVACGKDLFPSQAMENLRDPVLESWNERSQSDAQNVTISNLKSNSNVITCFFNHKDSKNVTSLCSGSSSTEETELSKDKLKRGIFSQPLHQCSKQMIREAIKNIDWSIQVNDKAIMSQKKPILSTSRINSFARSEVQDIFDGDTVYLLQFALSCNDERCFHLGSEPSEIYPIYQRVAISVSEMVKGAGWRNVSQEFFFEPEDEVEILFNDGALVDEIVISVDNIFENEETNPNTECLFVRGVNCTAQLINKLDEFVSDSNKTLESFQASVDEFVNLESPNAFYGNFKQKKDMGTNDSFDSSADVSVNSHPLGKEVASFIAKTKDDLKYLQTKEKDLINIINEYKVFVVTTNNNNNNNKEIKANDENKTFNNESTDSSDIDIISPSTSTQQTDRMTLMVSKYLPVISEINDENQNSETADSTAARTNENRDGNEQNNGTFRRSIFSRLNARRNTFETKFENKYETHHPRRGRGLSSGSIKDYDSEARILSSADLRQSSSSRINLSGRRSRRLPPKSQFSKKIKDRSVEMVSEIGVKSSMERLKILFDNFIDNLMVEKSRVSDALFKSRIKELSKTPQFLKVSAIFSEKDSFSTISSEIEIGSIERPITTAEVLNPVNNPLVYESFVQQNFMKAIRSEANHESTEGTENADENQSDSHLEIPTEQSLQIHEEIRKIIADHVDEMLNKITEETSGGQTDMSEQSDKLPKLKAIHHIQDLCGLEHIYEVSSETISTNIQKWTEVSEESMQENILHSSDHSFNEHSLENSIMEEFF